jgi:hypothetical protein
MRFQFNPLLLNPEYELPWEAQQEVDKRTCDLQSDVRSFVERASTMESFFPDLLTGSQADRTQARDDAEQAVAEPGWLSAFFSSLYFSLEPPLGERPFPPSNLLTEDWALYRYLQVQLLFGIDLYVRYQGNVPNEFSAGIFEKLEHDVLDAEVLMLGCLEGAFATKEKKLKRWWRLLCPDGALHE